MLHFLVERHEQAIAALASADAVGCNLPEVPRRHFSGNFWWAKASYLAGLAPVPAGDRHEAEWWVLSGQNARAQSLHDSGVDHHRAFYGRAAYAGEEFRSTSDAARCRQRRPGDLRSASS